MAKMRAWRRGRTFPNKGGICRSRFKTMKKLTCLNNQLHMHSSTLQLTTIHFKRPKL